MDINTYAGDITSLSDTEVFVFGANQSGFHGAGSAGYASFGVHGNRWREFDYGNKPKGWMGKWAVKGSVGAMRGWDGRSYGLVTVTRCGAKRSISGEQMVINIGEMYACARAYPELTFYVAQGSAGGLNGYSGMEMATFFKLAAPIPENVKFQLGFSKLF